MRPLEGKGAVVTGGSRGIGRAIVERLLADGVRVIFSYRQDESAAGQIVTASGGRAVAVRADLGEPAQIERLFEAVDAHLDGLDILVNNAGTTAPGLIADVTEEEYDRVMAVNAKGVFLCLQQAGRRLRDGGRVVNFSSVNTAIAGPGVSVYAGSKAAVEQFTRTAAREWAGRGITVNTVSPGATDTELLRGSNTEEGLRFMAEMTPLGRLGEPEDIAAVVAFLVGPDGGWVTGQNIIAGGGLA